MTVLLYFLCCTWSPCIASSRLVVRHVGIHFPFTPCAVALLELLNLKRKKKHTHTLAFDTLLTITPKTRVVGETWL